MDREGCLGSVPSSQLSTSQTPPIQLPLIGTLSSRSAQVVDWMACWVCKMNWPLFHPEEVSCRSGWKQGGERFAQLLSPSLPSTVAFVPSATKGGFCLPITGVQCRVSVATHCQLWHFFIVQHKVYKRALIWIARQYITLNHLTLRYRQLSSTLKQSSPLRKVLNHF